MPVEFRVFGGVAVRANGHAVEVGPARQRCVLAVLLVEANRAVSADELFERVWAGRPPQHGRNALAGYLSRLRGVFAPAEGVEITYGHGGYQLRVDPLSVDLHAFGDLMARADLADDSRQRLSLLDEALGLWRGEPFASLNTPWFDEVRTHLDAQRLAAVLDRNDAALACGRHAAMVGELSGLAAANPADERVAGQLILALYRCGRQDEAIRCYHRIRAYLVEEFGVDPGPGLQDLYRRLLAADPHLGPDPGTVALAAPTAGSRSGLPADVAVLAGRDKEIQAILDDADTVDGRATVLSIHAIDGMPGVGKSALAVHVAHRLAGRYPDGPVFVDLHGHSAGRGPAEPADVLAALLAADGVDARLLPDDLDGRSTLWRERLAGRRVLLVLDNAASTAQVQPLLPAAPGCLVIVTSRRFLGDLPAAVTTLPLDVLPADDAAYLFRRLVPRAGSEPDAVADVVAACGHLPLAIGLLARLLDRHRAWSVADLLAETRSRLVHLATEDLTVADAFDLSYRHLPPPQQRMLRLLGLHPGTEFEPYAAAALAGATVEQAAAWLQALHADNLLTEIGYHRYAMHDLLHQYARALIATEPASERRAALARLFDFYQAATAASQAALTREAAPVSAYIGQSTVQVPDVADHPDRALAWMRAERSNVLAALAAAEDPHRVVALTAGLAELLRLDGPWGDAVPLHAAAADAAEALGDRLGQANALTDLGMLQRLTGAHELATRTLGAALALYEEAGSELGQANALTQLGHVWYVTDAFAKAEQALRGALDRYERLGDQRGEATALAKLGALLHITDPAEALPLLRRALNLHRDLANTLGQIGVLTTIGQIQRLLGDYAEATSAIESTLRLARDTGDRLGQAHALRRLGALRRHTGDYKQAGTALSQALDLYRELGAHLGIANTLNGCANLANQTGRPADAERDARAALALYKRVGHRSGQGTALTQIGRARCLVGDLPVALAAAQRANDIFRDIHHPRGQAESALAIGVISQLGGNLDAAEDHLRRALNHFRQARALRDEARALAALGQCAVAAGRAGEGVAYLREAEDIFRSIGAAGPPGNAE